MDPWIAQHLATVPSYQRFLGVDEIEAELVALAREFPAVARHFRVGTSRLGAAIHAVQIGTGERDALVFALPHPNEPIGALTALHLARQLCGDSALLEALGLRFTIVGCIDPDGLRLNENWLAGPFTRSHYARHFYRPAGDQQIEWTFPVDHHGYRFDAVPPETDALVRLLDELRPELMVSLHNSEMGGAYYYLSRQVPELYPLLQQIPESVGVPLDRGEPESPEIGRWADGIYQGLEFGPIYDKWAADGNLALLSGGESSGGYAARYGTLTMFSEVPYWNHPASSDASLTEMNYRNLLREQGAALRELSELLQRILSEVEPTLLAPSSPFASANRYFVPAMAYLHTDAARRVLDPATDRPATVAERFSILDVVTSFRLRYGGMMLRMLDGELAVGNASQAVRSGQQELSAQFEKWCAAADSAENDVAVLPIQSLVATQYGAILACARHLTST